MAEMIEDRALARIGKRLEIIVDSAIFMMPGMTVRKVDYDLKDDRDTERFYEISVDYGRRLDEKVETFRMLRDRLGSAIVDGLNNCGLSEIIYKPENGSIRVGEELCVSLAQITSEYRTIHSEGPVFGRLKFQLHVPSSGNHISAKHLAGHSMFDLVRTYIEKLKVLTDRQFPQLVAVGEDIE